MSQAKERRRAQRAAAFSGHQPDPVHHPETSRGREYDSAAPDKSEKRPTESVQRDQPGTPEGTDKSEAKKTQ